MNVTGKLDLDGLLREWPAPATRDEAGWDARADQIVAAARARRSDDAASLVALLDTPALDPEPGEAQGDSNAHAKSTAAGDVNIMSQESDQGGATKSDASVPGSRVSQPPAKRPSLKEIAERASQSGRASVVPGGATISTLPAPGASARGSVPPSRVSAPPGRGSIPPARGSMPPARAVEAGKDDSGVVDLNQVNASATPEQKAAAEKATPATSGLLDDEKPAEVAAVPARASRPAPAAKSGSRGGMFAGAAIAVLGLAAAATIVWKRGTPEQSPSASAPAAATAPAPKAEAAPPQQPESTAAAAAPVAQAAEPPPEEAKVGEAAKLAAAPSGGAAPIASVAELDAPKAAAGAGKVAAAAPTATGKPGDLSSAMQQAVGADGSKPTESEAAEPAAGRPANQNIPEQPSQGSMAAAIGAVMPSAKACVSGADDVSRAVITFSSAGTVSNVSVSGWAASNGQAGCLKSALKAAKVGPFSKPSFTFPVTIRP